MSTVCLDNTELLRFGVFLDDIPKVADFDAWFDVLDGLCQTLPCGLDQTNSVRVGFGVLSDVICLVQITVVAFVEERDINIEDITVLENPLVRNAVADDLVRRGADGLGEVVVV